MITLVPLSDRAIELRIPYRECYDRALKGELGRVERRGGRLFVEKAPEVKAGALDDTGGGDK